MEAQYGGIDPSRTCVCSPYIKHQTRSAIGLRGEQAVQPNKILPLGQEIAHLHSVETFGNAC